MVTFAQAQERAERWVNGSAHTEPRREVRVREFDLGFVAWAEESHGGGPVSGGRLVIARDSGDTTFWPALPVGEVIRRYEEEYGSPSAVPAAGEPPQAVDLEATSFLLTPPQWLQEAADRAGVPGGSSSPPVPASSSPPSSPPSPPASPVSSSPSPPSSSATLQAHAGPEPAAPAGGAAGGASSPWDGTDTSGSGAEEASVAPPATVFSPPVAEDGGTPPPPGAGSEARTAVMPQGSSLPRTAVHPSVPQAPESGPGTPPSHGAADLADADTAKASGAVTPSASRGSPLPPPGAPGAPGAPRPAAGSTDGTGGESGGYVPTRMVSAEDLKAQAQAHDAASPEGPGQGPPSQGGPASREDAVHQAATVLSPPVAGSPGPPSSSAPPARPAAPAPPGTPPPAPGYGYPQPGVPTVGSGYMAVLRYRGPDGSEQQLIRRSAPGLPHPEWQLMHELRGMNVPPQQVLELHTELQSCELPGGYCARMIQETWPQARITHTAAYGREHASRQAGVRHLVEHQDELQQFAGAPQRSAPVRAPLPQLQPAPAVGLDVIGQELVQAFGPQGVFRHDQHAVARQGVPEIVAQTLVWSGLPVEVNPFFWALAQPGRPVPTLAELAAERGVQPAPDAGSYLVIGTDFGRQLCVQYGTAHIVAVPLEAGPGGEAVPPQFVNASLPQLARCLALLGGMWRLRYGLNPEQAGRWTSDFQAQLASLDPQAVSDAESWWSVLLEQMWDGLL